MTTGPTDVKVTTAADGHGGMPLALKFNEGLGGMARSPLETMIDKACGVTAEDLARPTLKKRDIDRDAQALMDVGTAAVAWVKLRDSSTRTKFIEAERVLVEAAKVLSSTGW